MNLQEKAQTLINSGNLRFVGGNVWEAKSSSRPNVIHTIDWYGTGGRCTCEAFNFYHWCYHLEAVKMQQHKSEHSIFDEEIL